MLPTVRPLTAIKVLCLFLFVLLLLMGLFNRPISDDYLFANMDQSHDPISYAIDGFRNGNGRLGQYFVFSVADHVFGLRKAVMLMPIINTIGLALASAYFMSILLRRFHAKQTATASYSMTVGSLTALAMIFSTKSIFDSSLWLDSSVSYLPSLIFLIFNSALFIQAVYLRNIISFKRLAVLLVSLFVGQQFSEPTSVIVILAIGASTVTALAKRNIRQAQKALLGLLVATLGLLVIYISPGSIRRRQNYHSNLDLHAMFIGSLHYFHFVLQLVLSWRSWLFICLGITIFYCIRQLTFTKKQLTKTFAAGLVLMTVPYYILFIVSQYSSPNFLALRSYQVPAALCGLGISAITVVLSSILLKYQPKQKYNLLNLSMILFVIIALFTSLKPLTTIIKAEAIRSVQYDYREISIVQQLNNGNQTIRVFPAPILLRDAEPGEFLYRNDSQISFFEKSFIDYYHLRGKKLEVINDQIAPYCLTGQSLPWWNISNCEALHVPLR